MSDWFVSTYSSDRQTCVEVRFHQGRVHVRDSKNPTGPHLDYPASEWTTFLKALTTNTLTP